MKHLFFLFVFLPSLLFAAPGKTSSVLSAGKWWKFGVKETGIHKITYQDLVDNGILPSQLEPSGIRIYGNGGKMLPEANILPRPDDLNEVAIEVVGGEDGSFDPQDYIIFYASGPVEWTYNTSTGYFTHKANFYDDLSWYFLTVNSPGGKRVSTALPNNSPPDYITSSFTDYAVYENDSLSLIRSGKIWVGEQFSQNKYTHSFSFSFPSVETASTARVVTSVIARSSKKNNFFIAANGALFDTLPMETTDPGSVNIYAKQRVQASSVHFPADNFNIDLAYSSLNADAQGWLDFIEITCRREMKWTGGQMRFRDPQNIGKGNTLFRISDAVQGITVWEVTDESNATAMPAVLSGSDLSFVAGTDSLREFVAFDGSQFYPVEKIHEIPNQNLHALQPAMMVIVTPSLFEEQARRLAAFHQLKNHSVIVANVDQVYNEFSSGRKDISAIRDFMKMLFDRAQPEEKPKYLLLFGDGTYDPKHRIPNNQDLIPTFQSQESLKPVSSYVSDDFYGILGSSGGYECNGSIDIGIGRFPVSTPEAANIMIDKIIRYAAYSDTADSDWKNNITFIADDENANTHLLQAEQLGEIVYAKYPVFNVNKIYLDAYKMVQTPSGNRLPDVNKAINSAIDKGTLILNYTGHGGEDGWSAEKVLTATDIDSWKNYNKMPVFVTATCEFSRFDNPERYTAGEKVLIKPDGGGIALYSTTRLSLASTNFKLDSSFFSNLLPSGEGPVPTMGDLIRISKNRNGNSYAIRNFVLLGDPAQAIAYPKYRVVTTSVNDQPAEPGVPDTAVRYSTVKIHGEIRDNQNQKLSNFNGQCFGKMFDRFISNKTIGNTSDSYPQTFLTQNLLLFNGEVPVVNGEFEFSFVMPAATRPEFARGKLSLYARNGETDASGYNKNIVTGGPDPQQIPDQNGPDIQLYMDNYSFVNGGNTAANTKLIAQLQDPQGINYIHLGIGNEIIARLDGEKESIILNDFFVPQAGPYQGGTIEYPFENLSPGRHQVFFRCKDMFNNESRKDITFFVNDQLVPVLNTVYNHPNPFTGHTTFSFTTGEDYGQLEVRIVVYSVEGKKIATLQQGFNAGIGQKLDIFWNGRDDEGRSLKQGVYLYQMTATATGKADFHVNGKLVKMD